MLTAAADAYGPNSLLPRASSLDDALRRARIAVFVDTVVTKVNSVLVGIMIQAKSEEEKLAKAAAAVAAIKNDVVPLLADAAPFFGGSSALTLAEINTASFLLRIYTLGKPEHGFFPASVLDDFRAIPVWQKWVDALLAHPSVTDIYDEQANADAWRNKLAQIKLAELK